jgi:shikimate dehydrogenase
MTKRLKFGLVGYNVLYSRSPEIFQTIFDMTGTVGDFELYDLPYAEFDRRFDELANSGVDALSVTTPYKMEVARRMDRLDEIAGVIGAVNSLYIRRGRLTGYNTDCHGFASALRPFASRLPQAQALVLGCGGAARAVVYSLVHDFNIGFVMVTGRNVTKLQEFQRVMTACLGKSVLTAATYSELESIRDTADFELIVNCTPVGGGNMKGASPLPDAFLWPSGKIYYDLNYDDQIPAIAQANDAGLSTIDGRKMLVAQAVKSFELWTGRRVPFEAVFDKIFGGQ